MISSVSHPPSANFSSTVIVRIVMQSIIAATCAGRWRHQVGSSLRWRIQKTVIAMLESEKVTKTLIEYMTTRRVTSPRV